MHKAQEKEKKNLMRAQKSKLSKALRGKVKNNANARGGDEDDKSAMFEAGPTTVTPVWGKPECTYILLVS